jgi:cytochrome P450
MTTPLYEPLDPVILADPYPAYAELRREAPVYRVPSHGFLAVSRYRDVMSVLRDPELFSSAAMAAAVERPAQYVPEEQRDEPWDLDDGMSLIGTDGARHARLRGVVNRGFTPGRIAALQPRIESLVASLLAPVLERGRCDFVSDVATPLPVLVIAEMLGIDPGLRDDFRRWSEPAMVGVFETPGPEQAREVGASIVEMNAYFDEVIEERRRRPGDDLLSVLVRAEVEQGVLTAREAQTFAYTLLVAGSVTTTYLLSNALLALLRHPAELEKLWGEPALVPSLVEEALRYDPPVHVLFRTATRDTEIAGVTVPRDSVVVPLFASANRDESVFPEPDRFDLTRHPKDHLAFGYGSHYCLGAALARLEAKMVFEALVSSLRELELEEERVDWLPSLVFRGPRSLRVAFART